jgi:putative transposase
VWGLWIAPTEGAKFWLQVVTERKNRGVQDICMACVDGLNLKTAVGAAILS